MQLQSNESARPSQRRKWEAVLPGKRAQSRLAGMAGIAEGVALYFNNGMTAYEDSREYLSGAGEGMLSRLQRQWCDFI